MIVDTSAIMAVLREEPEATVILRMLVTAPRLSMSAGSWIELAAVTTRSVDAQEYDAAEQLFARARIRVEPVTLDHAILAREAYRRFGRGTRHEADLNFGDCFAYALAKATGEPLLFKGNDFNHTDVISALDRP